MPNHVKNILIVEGQPKDVSKFLDEIKGETDDRVLDFNKVTPRPDSLNIESGKRTNSGLKVFAEFIKTLEFDNGTYSLPKDLNKVEATYVAENNINEEEWHLGKTAFTNILLYGFPTWYEWAISNWGTKRNSYYGSIEELYNSDSTIKKLLEFHTARTAPHPIIKKLAEKYSHLHFNHKWAEDDIGYNCGERIYKDGCLYSELIPEDTYAFFSKLWGYVEEAE